VEGEVVRYAPEKDLAVVRGRCNELIVKGTPIGVEYSSGMSTEEWELIGEFTALLDGDDSESTTTACFPIDREIFWVCLSKW